MTVPLGFQKQVQAKLQPPFRLLLNGKLVFSLCCDLSMHSVHLSLEHNLGNLLGAGLIYCILWFDVS